MGRRHFKPHISTEGKPYKCVGWKPGPSGKLVPKFAPKSEKELNKMGLEPVYDTDGKVIGSREITKHAPLNVDQFPTNPCSEIMAGDPQPLPVGHIPPAPKRETLEGHTLYTGRTITVRYDEEDGDLLIKQTSPLTEREIRFGPLSESLTTLMDKGHWLECRVERQQRSPHTHRPIRVYLTDGTDRYKLYSICWYELQANGKLHGQYDLAGSMPNKLNLLRTHSSARYPKPVIQERVVETIIERDPFEILAERYKRTPKPRLTMDTMVGNRTLGERLQDHF